jgi:hypothetical protein
VNCTKCGATLPVEADFCDQCGVRIPHSVGPSAPTSKVRFFPLIITFALGVMLGLAGALAVRPSEKIQPAHLTIDGEVLWKGLAQSSLVTVPAAKVMAFPVSLDSEYQAFNSEVRELMRTSDGNPLLRCVGVAGAITRQFANLPEEIELRYLYRPFAPDLATEWSQI